MVHVLCRLLAASIRSLSAPLQPEAADEWNLQAAHGPDAVVVVCPDGGLADNFCDSAYGTSTGTFGEAAPHEELLIVEVVAVREVALERDIALTAGVVRAVAYADAVCAQLIPGDKQYEQYGHQRAVDVAQPAARHRLHTATQLDRPESPAWDAARARAQAAS